MATGLGLDSGELLEAYAARLAQFYSKANGGTDEHPLYSDDEWQMEEGAGTGPLAYWRWVASCIEADRAMWPWDREAELAVMIARAAQIAIEHFSGKGWVAKGAGAALIPPKTCDSELQGWRVAAQSVLTLPAVRGLHSAKDLASLPVTLVTHLISTRLGPSLQHLLDTQPDVREGSMREFERNYSLWVRLSRAAGVEVTKNLEGLWTVSKGPSIKELGRLPICKTEASAWREAANSLIQHLRLRMDISDVKWQQKPLSLQIELIQAFFSDARPSEPEEAFEQHFVHQAKALCRGLGWKVTRGKPQMGSKNEVWTLNQEDSYPSELTAWFLGADRIRQRTMECSGTTYLQWLALSLDDQILLAQEYLL
jgi:hypothetical protein